MRPFLTFLTFSLIALLTACSLRNATEAPASPSPNPTLVTTPGPALTPAAQETPGSNVATGILTPTNTTLIIWLPPTIASRTEAGAITLSDQLLNFNSAYPDLEIIVEQKQTSGQGGALNYLRTSRTIAPSILPDLIALPVNQLATAANEGLIFPMEEFLEIDLIEELLPAAQIWTSHNNHIVGYPFALTDMLHLEYSSIITQSIPLTWTAFISDTERHMVLPAAGPSGGRLALQFYLAAGGNLTNEAGQPTLEAEPLAAALEQLYNGRATGFILQQSSNMTSLADSVRLVRDGSAEYALTSSDTFLQSITSEFVPRFAPLPGWDSPLPPLINGWAWAISTPNPAEQALAAELIATLTTPENLGRWSRQSQILPALPAALDAWPDDDPYKLFAQQELDRALPMPDTATTAIMTALENAVFDIISLSKTPGEAANEAVTAVSP